MNFSEEPDRILFLQFMINIARWMRSIQGYIPMRALPATFTRKSPYPDITVSTTFIVHQNHVVKEVTVPIAHLHNFCAIYSTLTADNPAHAAQYNIQVSGALLPVKWDTLNMATKKTFHITVSPKGAIRIPDSSAELAKAICNILEFLVSFHRRGFVHRDLRWPNILWDEVRQCFFVIDFELAAPSGNAIFWEPAHPSLFRYTNKRNYMFIDDIKQVSNLIGRLLYARHVLNWTPNEVRKWDILAIKLLHDNDMNAERALALCKRSFKTM